MEIIIAGNAGFCWGVKRAMKAAEDSTATNQGPVTSLGPIIHNPTIVERLKEKGLHTAKNLDEINTGTVLIRAHGVPPKTMTEIQEKGLKVVDATCPIVKKSQRYAQRLTEQGYQVVIIGDKNHPEIIGILGHTDGKAIVIDTPEEAEKLEIQGKIGLIVQTTHSADEYRKIEDILKKRGAEVFASDTLCFETTRQQSSAVEVSRQVDVMIVVGGRNSANTVRLYNLCRETGVDTWHVESAQELQPEWFIGKNKVGLTGGASTPDYLINEVAEWVASLPTP